MQEPRLSSQTLQLVSSAQTFFAQLLPIVKRVRKYRFHTQKMGVKKRKFHYLKMGVSKMVKNRGWKRSEQLKKQNISRHGQSLIG